VLAYGTNEASDPNWSPETYQAMFFVPAAAAAPRRAGIDDPRARPDGPLVPHAWGVKTSRRLSTGLLRRNRMPASKTPAHSGNTRERMGGKSSMREWVASGLGQPDYVHFTSAGYRKMAAVLYGDILEQFQNLQEDAHGDSGPHFSWTSELGFSASSRKWPISPSIRRLTNRSSNPACSIPSRSAIW